VLGPGRLAGAGNDAAELTAPAPHHEPAHPTPEV